MSARLAPARRLQYMSATLAAPHSNFGTSFVSANVSDGFGGSFNPPPARLYKYLSAERAKDVLATNSVRFTSLVDTNDSFEIRSTFNKFAGPRFITLLTDQMKEFLVEENMNTQLQNVLNEAGLTFISIDETKAMFVEKHGTDYLSFMKGAINGIVENFLLPNLNDQKIIDGFLTKMGSKLMCFSVSERNDIPPMWAHYAGNSKGFVIGFDTDNAWFRAIKDKTKYRVQKISYFDGKLEEPLEDVNAALMSKATSWSYEAEWRIYISPDQVERTVGSSNDPIHLVSFPPDAISEIILGPKADDQTVALVRSICLEKYPAAKLFRAVPDRIAQSYRLASLPD